MAPPNGMESVHLPPVHLAPHLERAVAPVTVYRSQLFLESLENRNPPSSLLVGAPAGGATSAPPSNKAVTPLSVAVSNGAPVTAAPATGAAQPATASGSPAGKTSGQSVAPNSAFFSSPSSDPFADLFADPLGSRVGNKPPAGGGGGGGGGGGSGGSSADSGKCAAGNVGVAFTAGPVTSSTPGDDLLNTANTLSTGISSTPTVPSTASPGTPSNQTTTTGTVAGSSPTPTKGAGARTVSPALGTNFQTPLSFAANVGQTDPSVRYLSQSAGFSVFLTDAGATFLHARPGQARTQVLQLQLNGANPQPQIVAQNELLSRANYFLGNSTSQAFTDVPEYSTLEYQNIYPGIDLVFHSNADNQFEYDFQVQPGASLSEVHLSWQGAEGLSVDPQGNLRIQTATGTLIENAPSLFQTQGATHEAVSGSQVLLGNNQVGFTAGSYNASQPLVVDPVLGFSTYLGGSGNDYGNAVAVTGNGSAIVTGSTTSTNLPTTTGVSGRQFQRRYRQRL